MRGANSAKWVAGAIVVALAATACGGGDSDSKGNGKSDGIISMEIGEPQNTLVPSNTYETEGSEVIGSLFTGLVKTNEENEVVNDLAQSFESTDSKVWKVKLKPGYTFHNGEKVTAESFVNAWNWAANQDNAQQTNPMFSHIAGYTDLNPGPKKKVTKKVMSGLKVDDETSFTITLDKPFAAFKTSLAYTSFAPLPKVFYDDPKGFGEAPIGNGPYKMSGKFKHNEKISVVKYAKYPDASDFEVKGINFRIYSNADTSHKDLLANNLDIEDTIPTSGLATAKKDLGERYMEGPDSGVGYIGFPLKYNKAFQNKDLRKAISMAIDRETISDKIFLGARMPADDFISPIIPGYRQGACGDACKLDAKAAKALYKKSGGLPDDKLELGYNADGDHKGWVEAAANQIQTNLGIKVTAKPFEQFQTILNDLDNKKYSGGFRMGWNMDYPHMENYLRPIFSKAAIENGSNYAGYVNEKFEKLIAEGDQAKTNDASIKKYQDADDILLDEMPYIPVYFYKLNAGFSTKIKSMTIIGGDVEWSSVKLA